MFILYLRSGHLETENKNIIYVFTFDHELDSKTTPSVIHHANHVYIYKLNIVLTYLSLNLTLTGTGPRAWPHGF